MSLAGGGALVVSSAPMNNDSTVNVALVGVGGQGILLAADVLARAAAEAGLDVKKTEIHGMSQRGGSCRGFRAGPS